MCRMCTKYDVDRCVGVDYYIILQYSGNNYTHSSSEMAMLNLVHRPPYLTPRPPCLRYMYTVQGLFRIFSLKRGVDLHVFGRLHYVIKGTPTSGPNLLLM